MPLPADGSWSRADAPMIDVGGMTAQPGPVISVEEEVDGWLPVVEALAVSGAALSVDTYRPAVAAAALAAGAHAINDHTGLSDPATRRRGRAPRRRAGDHPPRPGAQTAAERPLRDRARSDRRVPARTRRAGRGRGRRPRVNRARPGPRVREDDHHRPGDPPGAARAAGARLPADAGLLAQGGDRRAARAAGVEPGGNGGSRRRRRVPRRASCCACTTCPSWRTLPGWAR